MKKTDKLLIIVESPNKCKTITDIVKKAGYTNAKVAASVGHIVELGNGGPAFNSGIYPDEAFKMNLKVSEDKKKVVSDLKALVKWADIVLLMTDPDREGYVIADTLINFLKIPSTKCLRAVTHEITPKAVVAAIENPVPMDTNLVKAGYTRMCLDKLIGFGLSPMGKKYVGAKSIGRCQSVGLKLVSDREQEIANFIPEVYYNLYLNFLKNNQEYRAKYVRYQEEKIDRFTRQADVDAVVSICKTGTYSIADIRHTARTENPKVPFCTATYQQEAAQKLGLRVKDAMSCAQKLFEGITVNGEHLGLITYMRTDSTEFAPEFIPVLEDFIVQTYGKSMYVGTRKGKKKATDQDGHEALRVVDPSLTPEIVKDHLPNALLLKVYTLIWQRTVASAMPCAEYEDLIYDIVNNGHHFEFSDSTLKKPGFKLVYDYDPSEVKTLTEAFTLNEVIDPAELEVSKKFTQPKAHYTEASLVKELQQREIGRPSTYATIVETILSPTRGYATLEDKQIIPTDRGMQLAAYCDRAFSNIINLNYTREMEEQLDQIASGKLDWQTYLSGFYNTLKATIEANSETGLETAENEKACPKCGSPMVVRRSRFGKLFYGCSTYPKCNGIVNMD